VLVGRDDDDAVAAAVLAGVLAPAGRANADVLDPDCAGSPAQVFLPWLDPDSYVLAPDGGFEQSAAGWRLSGGAAVVAGNEPWSVLGGSHSLSLPAGSSATSPAMCVGLLYPTVRTFATRTGGLLNLSTLRVDILYDGANGEVQTATLGLILGGGSWQPTLPVVALGNLLATVSDANSAVALRFTPVGSANWKIDDVYVDPYCRN
jgi:hypothetical protein